MAYRLGAFAGVGLSAERVRGAIGEHAGRTRPRLDRLWAYYRNPLRATVRGAGSGGRWYSQAQEVGLPGRLRGSVSDGLLRDDRASGRREIVIENDIAWRVQSMVDFMFGRPVPIRSQAQDEHKRARIEKILDRVWERSGGVSLLQEAATLGHVYGHVDLLLRVDEERMSVAMLSGDAWEAAGALRIEAVEPRRGVPILHPHDARRIDAYLVHHDGVQRPETGAEESLSLRGVLRTIAGGAARDESREITEIITGEAWHIYHGGELVWEQSRSWTGGVLPVVHIQNLSQPLEYEGLSEVEALIPLQDELNTRLSDRANRVTMQSFKMYLAKGVEGFDRAGPGQVWYTDNMGASIQAFGGDAESPSEDRHIKEVREALDKVSGMPPLTGGVIQGRVGSLSSANALRITLMGLLAKTARKRVTYGRGIAEVCGLVLRVLDGAGVLATSEDDRGVTLAWGDVLPPDLRMTAEETRIKQQLGVPAEQLLAELGYAGADAGVT